MFVDFHSLKGLEHFLWFHSYHPFHVQDHTSSSVATKLVSFVSSLALVNSFCCVKNWLRHKLLWWFPFFFQYTHDVVELHSLRRCPFIKQTKHKPFALDFLLCKLGYSLHLSLQCCFPHYTHMLLFVSPAVEGPVNWLLLSYPYRWYLQKSLVSSCSFQCHSCFYSV